MSIESKSSFAPSFCKWLPNTTKGKEEKEKWEKLSVTVTDAKKRAAATGSFIFHKKDGLPKTSLVAPDGEIFVSMTNRALGRGYLGMGSTKIVKDCCSFKGNKEFALCKVKNLEGMRKEVQMLKHLEGSTFPKVYASVEEPLRNRGYIVQTRYEKTLEKKMKRVLSDETKFGFGKQLLEQLCYFEQKGVIHRDIKPANILYGPSEGITIADFDISKMDTEPDDDIAGTVEYVDYSLIQGGKTCHANDVWSLGIVFAELFFDHKAPWIDNDALLGEFVGGTYKLKPDWFLQDLKDCGKLRTVKGMKLARLINRMLDTISDTRIKPEAALNQLISIMKLPGSII